MNEDYVPRTDYCVVILPHPTVHVNRNIYIYCFPICTLNTWVKIYVLCLMSYDNVTLLRWVEIVACHICQEEVLLIRCMS